MHGEILFYFIRIKSRMKEQKDSNKDFSHLVFVSRPSWEEMAEQRGK